MHIACSAVAHAHAKKTPVFKSSFARYGLSEKIKIQNAIALFITAAGLAQSVERLTAEREVAGSIPGAGPILRVLKQLRNEGTPFALQAAGPSRGSDDHGPVKYSVPS